MYSRTSDNKVNWFSTQPRYLDHSLLDGLWQWKSNDVSFKKISLLLGDPSNWKTRIGFTGVFARRTKLLNTVHTPG
jgi:hypothetical protein